VSTIMAWLVLHIGVAQTLTISVHERYVGRWWWSLDHVCRRRARDPSIDLAQCSTVHRFTFASLSSVIAQAS
jgi:hypothetical protein